MAICLSYEPRYFGPVAPRFAKNVACPLQSSKIAELTS